MEQGEGSRRYRGGGGEASSSSSVFHFFCVSFPSLLPLLLLLVTSLPDVADPASFMCAQCEALGEFLQMAKARVASLAHVARRKQGAKVSRKAFSKHRSIIT